MTRRGSLVVVVMTGGLRSVVNALSRTVITRRQRGDVPSSVRRYARPVDSVGTKIPKRKVALLLGYQGAKYYGLQRQPGDQVPTIESELERALAAAGLVSEANQGDLSKIGWTRAARTDKAVSAGRQVVTAKLMFEDDDVEAGLARLNAALPEDIRVFDAVRVTKGFDSKRACDRRRYSYLLPTALLASDQFIQNALGVEPSFVEEVRARIIECKKTGLTRYDWRLSEAQKDAAARRLCVFRVDPDIVARLRAFLGAYCGTRNFHNFTAGMAGDKAAATRYILEFGASEPFDHGDHSAEWIQLSVVGQSFMLHQIRKMVAVAAQAVRLGRGPALLDNLCSAHVDIPLQLVPGDGLYLGEPIFDSYNRFKSNDQAGRPRLEWTDSHPKFPIIEAFRRDIVEARIIQAGHYCALKPFVDYLWMVHVFGFSLSPDEARHPVNSFWHQESKDPQKEGEE